MIKTSQFTSEFISAQKPSQKLMIVLHGKGDSLTPFKNFDEELQIPDLNFLLLNAPQKFMGGYSWYKEPPYMKSEVQLIRSKMFQLLDEVMEQGWLPENIFLFGFSQGCLISADVAMHFPYKLAGVIGISGYFHFYPRWRNGLSEFSKQTPWLFTHGYRDTTLPLAPTKFGAEKLSQAGLKVDFVEMNKGHVIKDSEYPLIRKWVQKQIKYLPDASQRS